MSALRIVLVAVAVLFAVQIIVGHPHGIEKREVEKDIEDAFKSAKTSLDNLFDNFKDNDMVKNITSIFEKLGDEVTDQGKKLVEKIQSVGKN